MHYLKWLLPLTLLLAALVLSAQQSSQITVFVDEETLTVYVPGSVPLSLQQIGFEVVDNAGQRHQYYFEDYRAFRVLNFGSITPPVCLHLKLNRSDTPLPLTCDPTRTLTQRLNMADVFWYDSVTRQLATLSLIQGVNQLGFCSAENPRCNLIYTPPTFTPTYTPTATPTITPTPTSTPTPLPLPERIARQGVTRNAGWQPYAPYEHEFDGVPMVLVPAGCFTIGSEDGETDERDGNQICFDAPYWMDKYEVSQADFLRLRGRKSNDSCFDGPDLPEECITWFEAQAFCDARGGRLPTEAEWEYAARGPDGLPYPWGNTFDAERVSFASDGGPASTIPVNVLRQGASWVGAEQLSGNVWEWTLSEYREYPYQADDDRENTDRNREDISRVLRGGSFLSSIDMLRSSNRNLARPNFFDNQVGLRCMRPYQ